MATPNPLDFLANLLPATINTPVCVAGNLGQQKERTGNNRVAGRGSATQQQSRPPTQAANTGQADPREKSPAPGAIYSQRQGSPPASAVSIFHCCTIVVLVGPGALG